MSVSVSCVEGKLPRFFAESSCHGAKYIAKLLPPPPPPPPPKLRPYVQNCEGAAEPGSIQADRTMMHTLCTYIDQVHLKYYNKISGQKTVLWSRSQPFLLDRTKCFKIWNFCIITVLINFRILTCFNDIKTQKVPYNRTFLMRKINFLNAGRKRKLLLLLILMSGVFSVGGKLSLIVIKKTVIDRRALMPRVTFSPLSDGT